MRSCAHICVSLERLTLSDAQWKPMLRLIRYDLYHIFEVHVPKPFKCYVLTTSMNMKTQIEKLLAFGIWSIYTVLIGDLNIYAFKRGARPSRTFFICVHKDRIHCS
jgi:hypothetical protein